MVRYLHQKGADLGLTDDAGHTPVALAKADYAEGLGTPQSHRLSGWDEWLQGMVAINHYFDEQEPEPGTAAK